MNPPTFALLDYGSGNLRSVAKALEAVGARVIAVDSPAALAADEPAALVLPGVGAFGDCTEQLRARDLWEPVADWLRDGRPFLGLCLGLQMLFETSEESPGARGFGRFRGAVRRFTASGVKVPHIGWNSLRFADPADPAWAGLGAEPPVYFVHSFRAETVDDEDMAATCDYGGPFCAAVRAPGPLLAVQFHPEKSQRVGLAMLRNFVGLASSPALAAADA